jgi:large subunit ribosomal protein L21
VLSFRQKLTKEIFNFFFGAPKYFSFKNFEACEVFIISFFTFAVQFSKAMYAIVEIAGKQFKVAKDQYIYAPKMEGDAGAAVSFDKVLLTDDGGSINIGAPLLSGIAVSGKIVEHVKGNKVLIFKKKRRKGYAVKNGHRQQFTKVQIDSIG